MKRTWGFITLFIIWEITSRAVTTPMMPPVSSVILSVFELIFSGEILDDIAASMLNIFLGFLIASILGFSAAIAIAEFSIAELILMPLVDSIRPVAALTIYPLLITILGLGIESKVFVIFWTAWPAVLLNTVDGLRRVDGSILGAAQVDGANRIELLYHILIPLASPMILTGLRIGLSGGWISLVSSEMLGAHKGLGYSILAYSQTFRFPQMYAVVIIISLSGLLMNIIFAMLQKRVEILVGIKGGSKSRFLSFHDRASTWGIQTLFTRESSRNEK